MTSRFEHVLARRGVGGHRQYRIPALAVSTRGTLLAAYDGRPNLDDLPNPIDLLLRRSTDNGQTWGPQQTVRTGTGLDGYGDPSLLIDNHTGRIFMFHAAGTHAGFFESAEGLAPEDAIQHADLSFSDDDGATWQHRRLTAMLKRDGVTGLFAAAGAGIQLHTGPFEGRLVQQFVVLFRGEIRAASAYSDDHGDTWTLGEFVAGANENKVACRSDGSLLMHSRATPHRLTAVSTDGGRSWSPAAPHPELPDPSDNGSLARFDGLPNVTTFASPDTDGWLLATHNHDTLLRRNTVLKLSQDNGASWPHAVVLCPGSSEYSTAARLPDGRIGVLYERQGYQEIVFVSLDPQELLDSPTAALTHDGGTSFAGSLAFDVVLRSVTPARPAVWRSTGESFTLLQTDGGWDPSAWKEVGQGYTLETPQVLSNRESQDLNYGPITAGYKAGDVLSFSGRVGNRGAEPAGVVVRLNGTEVAATASLGPDEALGFTANYTATKADLAAGVATATFALESRTARTSKAFTFNTTSGDLAES
ncbi:exo-alpha-sialidase [Arthrobacter livingstonensis]|uniref:exo-alpha-sialidase n=1 Tax=Arthrobacter livingstonensis TaxID=670078 RepID=A0A2V5L2J4_9MICC|nr:sialidase family protein [Arthrobacter livingstonensis]PYI65591.1 exo-alpha-sialidase [Arthrobacter livingstonensis]